MRVLRFLVATVCAVGVVAGLVAPAGASTRDVSAPTDSTQTSGLSDAGATDTEATEGGSTQDRAEDTPTEKSPGTTQGTQDIDPGAKDVPSNDGASNGDEPKASDPTSVEKPDSSPRTITKPRSRAAAPLAAGEAGNYCTVPGLFSLDTNRNVIDFPTNSDPSTIRGVFATTGTGTLNGLAISPDGKYAYAAKWGGNTYSVQRLAADADSGSQVGTQSATSGSNGGAVLVGAIDPSGTYYYFGHFTRSGNTTRLELWAMDLSTNAIAQKGRATLSNAGSAGSEGDIAFDLDGNLLILWGSGTSGVSRLYKVNAANVPTSNSTNGITNAQVGTFASDAAAAWNGMAFDSAGKLWLQRTASGTASRQEINPSTGALVGSAVALSQAVAGNDLASCGPNWRVVLQKNIIGRVDPGDQFAISIRDGSDVARASAVTTGSSLGVQDAKTNTLPVNGQTGALVVSETAAGGANLAGYTSTYGCTWQAAGDNLVAPGTALPFSLASGRAEASLPSFPANRMGDTLVCIISNTAKTPEERAPKIVVTKALGGNRVAGTDQFTVSLFAQGVASPLRTATTTGTGSNVNSGSTTAQAAETGVGYVISESASGTTDLTKYSKTFSCTWSGDGTVLTQGVLEIRANGRAQAVLPPMNLGDRVSQTLTCVITNSALSGNNLPLCTVGNLYVVDGGQMKRVLVSGTTGTVSNLGNSAGVDLNGLGIAPGGVKAYAVYRDSTNANQGRVYTYNTSSGNWSRISSGSTWDINLSSGALVAGAVSPTGTYYSGGFTTAGAFYLQSMNAAGTAMVNNGYLDLDSYDNGDIYFDGDGNMFLVRGKNSADFRRTTIFRVAAADLVAAAGTNSSIPFTTIQPETVLTGMASGAGTNGAGFDVNGRLYVSTSTALYFLEPITGTSVTLSGGSFSAVSDLGTCSYPPTVSLRKELPGGRFAPADRFGLEVRRGGTVQNAGTNTATINGGTSLGTATAQSPASGLQSQSIESVLVASGQTVSLLETFTNGAQAANYTSGYVCTVDDQPLAAPVGGSGSAGQFTVPNFTTSSNIVCTFKNSFLQVSKTSNPASGTLLSPDGIVTYTLTFDNSSSAGAAAVAHRDHLADVLDDAYFVNAGGTQTTSPVTTATVGLTATWDAANKRIEIAGSVPAATVGTVTFRVKVKANDVDALARGSAGGGYLLRNYLTRNNITTPPTSCSTVPGDSPMCTEHPVRAWTLQKSSQPEDGAKIHSGGNIYYRVKITNFSGSDLTGVTVTDNLTQTLAATVWDPAAPAAMPQPNGISFYRADGSRIISATYDRDWATTGSKPVFSGSTAFDPDFPAGMPFPGGTWTFTTPAFTVPAMIGSETVAYAIVGYAVQGGYVADPANPANQYISSGAAVKALPDASWVNTAQAGQGSIGGQSLYPNRCSAAGGGIAPGNTGTDLDCKTWHSLGESYFHIWKKSANPVGQNLLGSTFVIADTEADARAAVPSRWLCRVENAVPNPNDVNSVPIAAVGSTTAGTPDFGESSATHASIALANQKRAAYNLQNGYTPLNPQYRPQLAQCGQFFYLSAASEGQAAGSWRAVDVRGGDLASGTNTPLANWRTASAFNNGADISAGRHGAYWLAETVSPTDHQLLAQPMQLWVAPDAPSPATGLSPGTPAWYDYQGRLSMPTVGLGETAAPGQGMGGGSLRRECVSPYELPPYQQPACVMPTGWTMPVFDTKMRALPLAGGAGSAMFGALGGLVLLIALGSGFWWRRRRSVSDSSSPIH